MAIFFTFGGMNLLQGFVSELATVFFPTTVVENEKFFANYYINYLFIYITRRLEIQFDLLTELYNSAQTQPNSFAEFSSMNGFKKDKDEIERSSGNMVPISVLIPFGSSPFSHHKKYNVPVPTFAISYDQILNDGGAGNNVFFLLVHIFLKVIFVRSSTETIIFALL